MVHVTDLSMNIARTSSRIKAVETRPAVTGSAHHRLFLARKRAGRLPVLPTIGFDSNPTGDAPMPTDPARAAMLETLRNMLRDVFRLRRDGTAYARLSRAHGYVDGYMRALMESGLATQQELIEVVAAEGV